MRRLLGAVLGVLGVLGGVGLAPASAPAHASTGIGGPQTFQHVWIVVLENTNAQEINAQTMPYWTSLAKDAVTLTKMYGVGHASLTNYIGLTSGHAPVAKTKADCPLYDCVYGAGEDDNIANQLEATGLTWKAYVESLPKPCPKPTPGQADPYQVGYATRHNPFMYYASIVDDPQRCADHIKPLTDLPTDVASTSVPSYSFVVPNTCHDAHDDYKKECGLGTADSWLRTNLAPILASKAYQDSGAIVLTFDEAEGSDSSNCCDPTQPGGGRIATEILSPLLVHPGTTLATPASHYAVLRTIEDNFAVPCLRNACAPTASLLDLFRRPAPPSSTTVTSTSASSSTAGSSPTKGSAAKSGKSNDSSSNSGIIWTVVGVGVALAIGALLMTRRTAKRLAEADRR